ncbi:hypothetical protein Sarmat_00055 [Rickettsiales endosymbiont of Paramecium tredecaurelia]|nr:hypothetical protein [Candidatus Sarmatiella mevalonica]
MISLINYLPLDAKIDLFRNSLMMSKCEEYTKHRAAAYMKYVRTCASTASPQLPSGVELGKRSNNHEQPSSPFTLANC